MAITRKHKNKNRIIRKKMSKTKLALKPSTPTYVEHVSKPWFTLISLGLKTVEGRKNKGRFKDMQVGEIIEWRNDDFMPRSIQTRIIRKAVYNTFKEYLTTEGLDKCLPSIPTLEHGLSVYYKYFTKEDEAQYGVVAIELQLINH